jgi:hypothetical protein
LLQAYHAQAALTQFLGISVAQSAQHAVDIAQLVFDLDNREFPYHTPDAVFDAISSLVSTVGSQSFSEALQERQKQSAAFASALRVPSTSVPEPPSPVPMDVSRPYTPIARAPAPFSLSQATFPPTSPVPRPAKRHRTGSSSDVNILEPLSGSSRTPALPSGPKPGPYRRNIGKSIISDTPLETIPSSSSQDQSISGEPSRPIGMTVFPSQPPPRQVLKKKSDSKKK